MNKHLKKAILLSSLFLSFHLSLHAQIFLHNHTPEPVWVAIGMYYGPKNFKAWHTQGWYKVEPNEKKVISDKIGIDSDFIYYFAQTSRAQKLYEGNEPFLVQPDNAFLIKNANMQYVKNEHNDYIWRKFRVVDMKTKVLQSKYTIELYD